MRLLVALACLLLSTSKASPITTECGAGPGCSGSCATGKQCMSIAGSCMCSAVPPPTPPPSTPCGPVGDMGAQVGGCGGSCPPGRYCASVTGSCMCIVNSNNSTQSPGNISILTAPAPLWVSHHGGNIAGTFVCPEAKASAPSSACTYTFA